MADSDTPPEPGLGYDDVSQLPASESTQRDYLVDKLLDVVQSLQVAATYATGDAHNAYMHAQAEVVLVIQRIQSQQ